MSRGAGDQLSELSYSNVSRKTFPLFGRLIHLERSVLHGIIKTNKFLVWPECGQKYSTRYVLVQFFRNINWKSEVFFSVYISEELNKYIISPSTFANTSLFENSYFYQETYFQSERGWRFSIPSSCGIKIFLTSLISLQCGDFNIYANICCHVKVRSDNHTFSIFETWIYPTIVQ